MAGETFTQEQVDALIAERIASEVAGLKENHKRALDELKPLRARVAAYDGLDPDEAKGYKAKLAELETAAKAQAAGITQDQLVKMRAETASEYEKKYGPVLQERDALKSAVRELKLDTVVKGLMAKGGARAERIDALFRLTSDRYDLTDDGQPMLKSSAKELDKYIGDDLMKEYPEFFNGSGSSGGGASKSTGGAGRVGRIAAPVNGRFGQDFLAHAEAIAKGTVDFE